MENLTLYDIESQLAQLVSMREEAADDLERQVIDEQIAEYLRAEIKKVDRIIPLLRNWEALALARKAEAARLADSAKVVTGRIDRLKAMILTVMQSASLKKLEGTTGTLLCKGNGGRQAVTVTDASLVPDDLMDMVVTMTHSQYAELRPLPWPISVNGPTPSKARIGELLARGEAVPGCRLEPRGEHVEVK